MLCRSRHLRAFQGIHLFQILSGIMKWRSYWLGLTSGSAAALFLLGYFTAPLLAARPTRPEMPDFGRVFVSEYNAAGWDATHDIFFHGLFNMGDRLRRTDLFLVGSSHFEFGLSAARMASLLAKNGRAPHVYNLSGGCGETAGFGLDTLAANGVSGRSVIAEAGFPDLPDLGPCARRTEGFDRVQAYFDVFRIWTKCLYDWMFDPLLPRLVIAEDGLHVQRFMYGLLVERDWETGDVMLAWHPVEGAFYPNDPIRQTEVAAAARDRGHDWRLGEGEILVNEKFRRKAAALDVDLSETFVPWVRPLPDFDRWYNAQTASIRPIGSEATRCLIPIPVESLLSWDGGNHLTGTSRSLATERLAAGIEAGHCVAAVH
jgi:hypothetical protein